MSDPILYRVEDRIAFLTMDAPPVNSLGQAMRAGLLEGLQTALADDQVDVIVLGSSQRVFCGGADISEFGTPRFLEAPNLFDLLNTLEAADKPVVAAINGFALGGGLELALACDYRFAAPAARLGLPEVNLGLIPGAGGTQRLPRLASVPKALDMIISGKPISAEDALEHGIVDAVAGPDEDLTAAVTAYAHSLASEAAPVRSCNDIDIKPDHLPEGFFDDFRAGIASKTQGYPAPEAAIQAVEAAVGQPFRDGLAREQALFFELGETPQARALQHLFFAERASRKIPGLDPKTARRDINTVGIVGAGTMGAGIAMCFANAGVPVTLVEISDEALERGLGRIRADYDGRVERGRLDADQRDRTVALIEGTTDFQALSHVDLVIEAVFEDLAIKVELFEKLDDVARAGAILATNTSYQDVDRIAAATNRPRDVVGLHFFSPANIMRLLEVVRGAHTADDVLLTALDLGKRLKKVPVVSGVCHGFIGNRMLEPYSREAARLLLEGATPAQVDAALTSFGFAMGIFAVMDLAGIDVFWMARQGRRDTFADDPGYGAVGDALYELGRYGQKTGRGFYIYEGREKTEDPEVVEIAAGIAARLGIERREISEQEIIERCAYPLIDEGARILEEGIAYRSGDIDLVWVNGYGFPPWRGGPMQYADEIGARTVLDGMRKYRDALGDYGQRWFQPSALLQELATDGGRFSR